MTDEERIRSFDSQGQAYKQAFQLFLDHTDQKAEREALVTAGGGRAPGPPGVHRCGGGKRGNGQNLRGLVRGKSIAIEPNAHLLSQLRQALPAVEAI